MSTTTTTTYPATVQELIRTALDRGISPADLLDSLPKAPTGFHLVSPDGGTPGGEWNGPVFEGAKWKVTSHWNAEEGVTFYVDGDGDNAIQGAEAGKVAAALAEVAAMAG